jgi:hypothetical protein
VTSIPHLQQFTNCWWRLQAILNTALDLRELPIKYPYHEDPWCVTMSSHTRFDIRIGSVEPIMRLLSAGKPFLVGEDLNCRHGITELCLWLISSVTEYVVGYRSLLPHGLSKLLNWARVLVWNRNTVPRKVYISVGLLSAFPTSY